VNCLIQAGLQGALGCLWLQNASATQASDAGIEAQRGNNTERAAQIPQQVRVEIVQDQTGRPGPIVVGIIEDRPKTAM